MNVLGSLFNALEKRVFHVPAKDVQAVVDEYNEEMQSSHSESMKITVEDWRRFETVQSLYTAHRIQIQATPRSPLAAIAVNAAMGDVPDPNPAGRP